jgi:Tol biopolymer transport system component
LIVTFKLSTCDSGDKFADAMDPYTVKLGRFYAGLMYEETKGSAPIAITKSDLHFEDNGKPSMTYVSLPSWSPDGRKIAHQARNDKGTSRIEIAEIDEKGIASTIIVKLPSALGDAFVEELRWSPNGKQLGFIIFATWYDHSDHRSKERLFTVNSDGQDLGAVRVGSKDINVSAFAWSPAGDRFALRSDFEAKTICNHNHSYYLQAGAWPCGISQHLYTSYVDGSGLKRISKEPEFKHSQLFWVQ